MSAFDYAVSTTTTTEVARIIRAARRPLLLTHARVDGDALGSVLAMARALRADWCEPTIWLSGALGPSLAATIGPTPYTLVPDAGPIPDLDPDLIIICDTGAKSQLRPFADWVAARRERTVILDHHVNGDDLAAHRLVHSSCASATQLVAEVLDELGVPFTGEPFGVGEALFMGLATDSGWFKYRAAESSVFRLAARLLEAGVDKSRLYRLLEETYRPVRLRLMQRALASLELLVDERAAVMTITPADFLELAFEMDDLTGLVNMPMEVSTVEVCALIVSRHSDETKISFRSKPPILPGGAFVDVNMLAGRLGGGGHVNAAGARLKQPIDEARPIVLEAVHAAFVSENHGDTEARR